MQVSIDGLQADAREGDTIEELSRRLGLRMREDCIIAVRREVAKESLPTNLFEMVTTRGRMVVKVECGAAIEGWKRSYKGFEGAGVRWITRDSTVIGPIVTDFEPSKDSIELKQDEIALSLSGFSSENTHLVLSKKLHTGSYAPPRGCGVLGRVVYGRHLIKQLKMGDRITKVDPVIETKEAAKSVLRVGSDYELKEPVQVFTVMKIELDRSSPVCGEHAYNVLEDGSMNVTDGTGKFISCNSNRVLSLPAESTGFRIKGAVTVRNSGTEAGALYIYREETPITTSHTLIGRVTVGMELAQIAEAGDRIAVDVIPQRLSVLGKTQSEAEILLKAHGIKVSRAGNTSDTALIAEHEPSNTLQVYEKGNISCFGVDPAQLIKVRLFKGEAANSVKYFKRVTGLELKSIGRLQVYFAAPRMEMILFKGDDTISKGLLPENTPSEEVDAGSIGVTNSVKKFVGMIGVRIIPSKKFGPTAEGFDGTNMVGEVVENMDALRELKDGKYAYIQEVQ